MTEDLNLLVALDALLSDGSVAGAARRLGLSASAMSRTLARLRTATNDPLLVRAGRGMVLTPGALALRERAGHALQEARALLRPSSVELDLGTLSRTFTIRANEGFVEAFGAAIIAAATAVAPRVQLRFAPKLAKSAVPLREGSADLEIGVLGDDMGPEVHVQALFGDHFVGVVRDGHPLHGPVAVTLEGYIAYGHVVTSRRGRAHGPVDVALADAGVARQIVALVPNFSAALAVARASDLVALVPASFLGVGPAALHAFELPVTTAPITISQMWHPRSQVDPAHRWLRGLMLAVCRGQGV